MLQCRFGRLWMSLAAASSIQTLPLFSVSSRSTSSPNRRHSPQCGQSQLWKTEVCINSLLFSPVLLCPQTDVIHHNVASHSYGRRRFVLIVLIPSVGRYDPVHSTWSVIPVCLLFTSIPVGLLFQYVCYSSADVTQSIPVYLIFVS